MVKNAVKWFSTAVIATLLIITALSIVSLVQSRMNPGALPSVAGFRFISVLSGSMRPLLNPGDMIVTREVNAENIKTGDIITFREDRTTLVTHRAIKVVLKDNKLFFQTQGDANNVQDFELVSSNEIVGSYLFRIPYGGYAARFARSPAGFAIFIVIPIFLLAIEQIYAVLSGSALKDKEMLKSKGQ